jgi:hypothetical protein
VRGILSVVSRRFRRFLQAALALCALVLITAACSSSGYPVSYVDQIDAETGLSNVESNWLKGCTVGLTNENVTTATLADEANAVCECSFNEISGPDGIPFEDFVTLNDNIRSDPDSLRVDAGNVLDANEKKLAEIVKSCIERG